MSLLLGIKKQMCPCWYRCFPDRMGIEETENIHEGRSLPRFYKPEGEFAGFYYHLGANIQPGVVGAGRESGGDRNEKETWIWQPTGARERIRATKKGEDMKNWIDPQPVLTDRKTERKKRKTTLHCLTCR